MTRAGRNVLRSSTHSVLLLIIISGAVLLATPPAVSHAQECPVDTAVSDRIINADIVVQGRIINIVGDNGESIILRIERVLKGPDDLEMIVGIYGYRGAFACGSDTELDQVGVFFIDMLPDGGLQASYVNGGDAIAPGDSGTVGLVTLLIQDPTALDPDSTDSPEDVSSQFEQYGITREEGVPSWYGWFVLLAIALGILVFGRLFFASDKPF